MAYRDQSGDGCAGGQPPITRVSILEHLSDMIAELKVLAGAADAALLASILDLAQQEAKTSVARARQMAKLNS
jgi:hypothetical protein